MDEKIKAFGILAICGLVIAGILIWQGGMLSVEKKGYSEFGSGELKRFSSYNELKNFVKERSTGYDGSRGGLFTGETRTDVIESNAMESKAADSSAPSSAGGAQDYSQTNIQVEGVDEPDFVKNDGKYIYAVSKGKLFIIEAYPAQEMKKLSETELGFNQDYYGGVNDILIKGDKLAVFGTGYETVQETGIESAKCIVLDEGCYYNRNVPKTLIFLYDIADKENPELEENLSIDGNYVNARLIGDHAYIISQKEANIYLDDDEVLPMVSVNGAERTIPPSDIYYFDGNDQNFVFSIISSLNLENGNTDEKVYLTGRNGALYVSEENIYLSSYARKPQRESQEELIEGFIEEVLLPILPSEEDRKVEKILDDKASLRKKWEAIQKIIKDYSEGLSKTEKAEFDKKIAEAFTKFEREFNKELEKTTIHKIGIKNGEIE